MKPIVKIPLSIISAAAIFGVMYLIGSFVAWQFDPSKWSEIGRGFVGLVGGAFSCIVGAFIIIEL